MARVGPVGESDHDYSGGFAERADADDPRSAEQWARAVFEHAPAPVRAFLVVGWRGVLGLRLGPRHDAGHVLGWRLEDQRHDEVRLASDSSLIDAVNVVRLDAGRVTWTTYVRYRNGLAPLVWALVLPIHKATVSRLLRRAAIPGSAPSRSWH